MSPMELASGDLPAPPAAGAPSSPALSVPSTLSLLTGTTNSTLGIPMSQAIHSVNIKSLVSYTSDLQSHNYTKWCTLSEMVLGQFNLLTHVKSNATFPSDLEWTKKNLLVGNWLYSTISENMMDMCLQLKSPTAQPIWVHLCSLFTGNKATRVAHLECELHNLVQGDMTANAYCHHLQQLTNSLADCDAPVLDHALVHQLIRGLNPKFSVLKTLLLLLPKFPSFIEACELILSEEASREADTKRTTETAFLASGGTSQKPNAPPPAQPPPDRNNNNNFNNGGRGCGRDRSGGHGRGGCNGGCGGNGGGDGRNNFNGATAWSSPPSWGSPWGPG
jgi:hypothetical protein